MAAPSLLITHYQLLISSEAKSVVPGRLELPTSTLSVWRSNQLSYRTGFKLSALNYAPSFIYSLNKTDR